eukprot:tig00001024_g6318.t1
MSTVTVEERLPSRERVPSRERSKPPSRELVLRPRPPPAERSTSNGSTEQQAQQQKQKQTLQPAASSSRAGVVELDLLGLELEAAVPEWADYLDQNVLPVLTAGVSALLKTVEPELNGKRGPLDKRKLNPIDWLASYLMRHNPRWREHATYKIPRDEEDKQNKEIKGRSDEWRARKEEAFKAKYPEGVPRKKSLGEKSPAKEPAEAPLPAASSAPPPAEAGAGDATSPKFPVSHSMRRLGARARSFLAAPSAESEVQAAAQTIEDSERKAVQELQNAAEKLKRAEERLMEALSRASAEVEKISREAEMTILRGGITDLEIAQIRQKAFAQVFAVVLKVLEQRTAGKHAYVALVSGPNRDELRYAAAAGSNVNAPDGKRRPHMEGRVLIRGEGVSWQAVDERQPLVIPDVTNLENPDAAAVHFFGARRRGAFAAFPVTDSGGECIALLAMDNLGSPGAGEGFSEPDQRLAEALSKAVGVALDRISQAERRWAMAGTLQRLQNVAEEIEELAVEGKRPQENLIIPGFPIAHDTLTSPEKNMELKQLYETVLKAVAEHTGASAAYACHFPGQGEAPGAGHRQELQCVATVGPDRGRVQGRTLMRSESGLHAAATPRMQFAGSEALAKAAFEAADARKTVVVEGVRTGPAGAPRDLLEAGAHVAVPMVNVRGEVVGVIGASGGRRLGPGDVAELERLVCSASELCDAVARKHGGEVFPQLFSQAVNREAAKARRRGTGLDAGGTEVSDLYKTAVDGIMRYTRVRGVSVALKNAGRLGAGDNLVRTVAAVGTQSEGHPLGDVFADAGAPLPDPAPGPGRVQVAVKDKRGNVTGVIEVEVAPDAADGAAPHRLDPSEEWFLGAVGESLGAAVEELQQAKRAVEAERVSRMLEEEALRGVGDLDALYRKALDAIAAVTNASGAYLAMMLPDESAGPTAAELAAQLREGAEPLDTRPASGSARPSTSAALGLSSFLNTAGPGSAPGGGGAGFGGSLFPSFQYVAVRGGHEDSRHILGSVLARTINRKPAAGGAGDGDSSDGDGEEETEVIDDGGDYTTEDGYGEEEDALYEAVETGQPVLKPELRVTGSVRAFGMPAAPSMPLAFGMPAAPSMPLAGSMMALPLKDEVGNVFAMLGLNTFGSENRLGAPDLSFITSVSESLASAIAMADEKNKVATIAESTLERINEQLGDKVATYFAFQEDERGTLRAAVLADPEAPRPSPSPRPADAPSPNPDAAPLSARTAAGAPAGPSGAARIAASGQAPAGVPRIQIGDELPQLPDVTEGGDKRQFQIAVQDGQGRVVGRIGVDLRRLGRTLTKEEVSRVRKAASLLSKAMSIVRKKTKNRRFREPPEAMTDAERAPGLREKDRLRLMISRLEMEQLRQELVQLDPRQVAELRSYENPPKAVRRVVKAALYMLGHQKRELDAWNDARGLLGANFVRRIAEFDPTKADQRIDVQAARRLTTGLTQRDIAKHGSVAAQCTLEWVKTAVHLRREAVDAMKRAASAAASGKSSTGSATARPGLVLPRIAEDLQDAPGALDDLDDDDEGDE